MCLGQSSDVAAQCDLQEWYKSAGDRGHLPDEADMNA